MEFRKFGYTDINVPIIGQGTWQIPEHGKARRLAVESLIKGTELGMLHIDTAEMYGDAEEVISEMLELLELNREKLFVVDKVLPSNASYPGVIDALERSLKRLKLDYLDCYLLHWRGHLPLSETLAAFEKLQQDGKIRCFGVSNFDVEDLEEAQDCLTTGKIACNQVLYNLGVRGIERNLLPYCQKNQIALVGYTPFGSLPRSGSKADKALKNIASKRDVTARQIALAFLTRNDGTFTIPKASNLDHVKENAEAGNLELSKEEIEILDKHFPAPDRDMPLAML